MGGHSPSGDTKVGLMWADMVATYPPVIQK